MNSPCRSSCCGCFRSEIRPRSGTEDRRSTSASSPRRTDLETGRGGAVPRGPVLSPQRHHRERAAPARTTDDVPLLARALREKSTPAARQRAPVARSDGSARAYSWPGNVRELENVDRALPSALEQGPGVLARDLACHILQGRVAQTATVPTCTRRSGAVRRSCRRPCQRLAKGSISRHAARSSTETLHRARTRACRRCAGKGCRHARNELPDRFATTPRSSGYDETRRFHTRQLLMVVAIIGISASMAVTGLTARRGRRASAIGTLHTVTSGQVVYSTTCAHGNYAVVLAVSQRIHRGRRSVSVADPTNGAVVQKSGFRFSWHRRGVGGVPNDCNGVPIHTGFRVG